jgi:hypothetical protein
MYPHLWFAPEQIAMRVEELRREAEVYRLGERVYRPAGKAVGCRAQGHAGLARSAMSALGRLLVALGQQLQQSGPQPCLPPEGELSCGI